MQMYLNKYAEKKGLNFSIECFYDEAELLITKVTFDILILDIVLNHKSGLDLAKKLYEKNPKTKILFYSNYVNYAPDGYEAKGLGFILKPIDPSKLYKTLDRLMIMFQIDSIEVMDENHMKYYLNLANISHIEAFGRKTMIVFLDKEQTIFVNRQLHQWRADLENKHFRQCNRSVLVNVRNIKTIENNRQIRLINNHVFSLSKHYSESVKECLFAYLDHLL